MLPENIPDNHRAAELLAKYIQAKISEPEEIELNDWIIADENYYLFERLTSPANVEWSATWFTENGVSANFLKKPFAIYETTEERQARREFYYWTALISLIMIIYYLLMRFV